MRHATVVVALLLGSCLWADWLVAQRRDNKPTVRKVTEVEVADKKRRWSVIPLDVEFPDPAKFIQATASNDDDSDPAKKKVKWSQFISPETIEKEVGVISAAAVEDVKNPGRRDQRGGRGRRQESRLFLVARFPRSLRESHRLGHHVQRGGQLRR